MTETHVIGVPIGSARAEHSGAPFFIGTIETHAIVGPSARQVAGRKGDDHDADHWYHQAGDAPSKSETISGTSQHGAWWVVSACFEAERRPSSAVQAQLTGPNTKPSTKLRSALLAPPSTTWGAQWGERFEEVTWISYV